MSVRLLPHRFTVAQYDRMIDTGILKENDRVELIRGEIVPKMPIGETHIECSDRLTELMVDKVRGLARVTFGNPVHLADSEPEPDVVLKRLPDATSRYAKPGPRDVFLIIEIADSSLQYDRTVKHSLYAENGIVEYWIVNLTDGCLEVHRQPQADGTYADVRTMRAGDTIDLVALPGLTFNVADIV
jgi:Uma2 family endonuclease